MPTRKWILKFSFVAVASVMSTGAAHAAEKLRYEEIRQRLAPCDPVLTYRGFTVVTRDGKKYSGRRLRLDPDHVRIFQSKSHQDVPVAQLARIQIRQAWRYVHHIENSAMFPLAGAALCGFWDQNWSKLNNVCAGIMLTIATPPALAYTAATAPFFLAADAVAFLIPKKVYEIIP
ncbi:MAG TPA: hypothetical protein VGP79_04155 [Bryobacteraceae bacterium]|jgi:hypothetical protein|nr:hypothetical protein [Bryobacteraceae bacterium]